MFDKQRLLNPSALIRDLHEGITFEKFRGMIRESDFSPTWTKCDPAIRSRRICWSRESGAVRKWPKLKGSIGEGSNHSNFSHQSSVKFLESKENYEKPQFCQNSIHFARNLKKFRIFGMNFQHFQNICEIPTEFHQTLSEIQWNIFENG